MIRPEDVGKMVLIVACPLRGGGSIEVRAPIEEAYWLRALFTRNKNPFRTLRDIGFEVVARDSLRPATAAPEGGLDDGDART